MQGFKLKGTNLPMREERHGVLQTVIPHENPIVTLGGARLRHSHAWNQCCVTYETGVVLRYPNRLIDGETRSCRQQAPMAVMARLGELVWGQKRG